MLFARRCLLLFLPALLVCSNALASSEVRLTTDAAASSNPRVALDPQGNVVVVWQDTRYGNSEILWQKLDQVGAPLSPVVRITNTASVSTHPDVACDTNGVSHIVWQEGENVNGVGTVYFCRIDASGTKALADQALTDFSGSPRVTVPSAGTCDIVWHRFTAADQDMYYRRYNAAGVQTCERRFNAGTIPAIAKTPVISSASNGDAQLFWRDMNTSFQLQLRQGAATNACGAGANVAYNNSSAVSPTVDVGGPYVFMLFELSGNIYNFQGSGNACKISQGTGTSTRPSVGAHGAAGYGAWQDTRQGNSEIYFCSFWGCSNLSGDVRLTNSSGSAVNPDIAVDDGGADKWVVVWQDDRDGNQEVYLTSRSLIDPASLSGLVRDSVTNMPVPDAQVSLYQNGSLQGSTTTNFSGVYNFPVIPAGAYSIQVSRQGYSTLAVPTFSVIGGAATTQDWTLDPLHVTGVIRARYWPQSPEDTPVEAPWRWGRVQLFRQGASVATAFTDGAGNFDIHYAPESGDQVIAYLRGPYTVVHSCSWARGCDEVLALSVGEVTLPPAPVAATWQLSQAVNAYMHTVRGLRDFWFDRFGIEFTAPVTPGRDVATQLDVRVNGGGCGGPACSGGYEMILERQHWTVSGEADWYPVAAASDAVYHELGHVILASLARNAGRPPLGCSPAIGCDLNNENTMVRAIHEGLCDYFAATLNGDPVLCEGYLKKGTAVPFIYTHEPFRRLDTGVKAPASSCGYTYAAYRDLHILSGALWNLRASMNGVPTTDARGTDSIVVGTVRTLINYFDHSTTLTFDQFRLLLRQRNGGLEASAVDAAFAAHNVPEGGTPNPCPQDVALSATRQSDGIHLAWSQNPGVTEWEVYRKDGDSSLDFIGVSDYMLQASGLQVAAFVDSSATPWLPYAYVVMPSDPEKILLAYSHRATVDADTSVTTDVAPRTEARPRPSLNVFPNPSGAPFRISLGGVGSGQDIRLQVYEVSGRLIQSTRLKYRGPYDVDLAARGVRPGVYFIVIETASTRISRKVVLVR